MWYRILDQSAKPTLNIVNKYNGASYSENRTHRPDIPQTVSCKKTLSEGKHSKLMLRSSRMEAKKPYSKIRGKHPMSIWLRNLGEL